MRASRLLSILILLQLRARLTAESLANEFEVSVRTIYRDIDELSAAGIPVLAERGPGGGFQLLDGYRTRLTGLASDEAEAMFMIGLPGPAAALGMGSAASRAANKLLASLPPASCEGAGRWSARFHLDPVDWYRDAEPVPHLPSIARAVLEQRVIQVKYESWTSTKKRRLEPLGLVLKAGAWYLVARSADAPRIYKISNIIEHTILSETFTRPPDFDLGAFWGAELQRFEARLRPGTAILRASPIGLERLSHLGAYAAHAVRNAAPRTGTGWTKVALPIENIEHAALLLLGLGGEVEVVEPEALRMRVCEHAREIVQRYKRRA